MVCSALEVTQHHGDVRGRSVGLRDSTRIPPFSNPTSPRAFLENYWPGDYGERTLLVTVHVTDIMPCSTVYKDHIRAARNIRGLNPLSNPMLSSFSQDLFIHSSIVVDCLDCTLAELLACPVGS